MVIFSVTKINNLRLQSSDFAFLRIRIDNFSSSFDSRRWALMSMPARDTAHFVIQIYIKIDNIIHRIVELYYWYNETQLDRHQLSRKVKLDKCRCKSAITFLPNVSIVIREMASKKSIPMNIQRIQEDRQMRYWLSYQSGRNARYLHPRRSEVKGGKK